MVSKRRKLVLLAAAFVLCIAPIASVQASTASSALVAEGRALIFQGETTTYADIVAARDKFDQAVSSDPTDKSANLFYAVTRIAASLIETSPAGLNTVADLATLFGLNVYASRPLGEEPISEPPRLYDHYAPPDTVPDGETVRTFLGGPFMAQIDDALANLEAVGSGYGLTLSAEETGDQPVEIDEGDILLLKSSLQLLKASLLIVTAYDLDVDLRELMVLGNAGVLRLQKMLDNHPDLLKLRTADGAARLAAARANLMAGIDSARAAYDAITLETDDQGDDLFYFDSPEAQRDALASLVELEEVNGALVANRAAHFSETTSFNPNAVFGNSDQNPLDIRAVLPKFGIQDDAVAGTFPTNANGQVLNGILPDATTNEQLAKEWKLRHETYRIEGKGSPFFNIPAVADGAIVLDGSPLDWPFNSLVFEDFISDENQGADLSGGDIHTVYTARDGSHLYIGIQLADGDPLAQPGMVYVWEAMNDYGNGNQAGNLVCYAYYADGQWVPGIGTRNADPWTEPINFWTGTSGDVAAGTGFIEWRVPLSLVGNQLSGRWLRVYSHQTEGGEISDDNPTQIRLDTATLSGAVSCADCPAGGKFFIAALPCADPIYRCGEAFGNADFLESSGSYSLNGIPIGATVFLHVFYDADNNGILDFGDTLGVSGPVTIHTDANPLNGGADTPVDDNFVMTKPGVYRVFGADSDPLGQPYNGPWNPDEIDWSGAELTFLGEFTDTATIPTNKFYKYILILWQGDRIFNFDAIQDLTAGTAFRTDANGNPTADGWITAGLSNLGGDQWQEPSNFSGPPDGQTAVNGNWPGFVLLAMPDDTVDDTTARQLQVTVSPPFTFDATLMHLHNADGLHTLMFTDIYGYDGNLPQDIDEWAVTGPGLNVSYTGAQIAAGVDGLYFDPTWNEISISMSGTPQVGAYTFRLTIDGQTRTYTDMHHINRTLPLPDISAFKVHPDAVLTSKTPMFAWAPITDPASSGIAGAPIAYRLQIRDRTTRELIISTPRTHGMTHYTVPAGKLAAGRNYEYRVRATDSSNWLDVQNRSHSAWVPFSMAADLNHASAPQFKPDWNALTWTTPNGTSLACRVTVYDPDGIASDGSSHMVTVVLPDGSSADLDFDQSIDNQTAYYWGSGPPPANPAGIYNFTVTDLEGRSANTSDTLVYNPLAPVDPALLRPSLSNPVQEYMHAVFDDVKVNGVLCDTFDIGPLPDTARWNYWDNGAIRIDNGALHLSTLNSVGRADTNVALKNPGSADAVEANVTVADASSDNGPQARISGYWFNLNGLDVWAGISVTPNRVVYSIDSESNDETNHWEELANGTLKTIEPGETVNVGIAWNGTSLVFKADEAAYTYTPTGTILPARYPDKRLQARINLLTSVTPTFRWNPIAGANRYRVRIYNHDNSRTIHPGFVNDGQTTTYTVPCGVLRPGASYRYRVEAWDATETDVDNISKTPASNGENFIFYTGKPGDMNNDGFVDLSDAILALRVMSGDMAVRAALAADADADGRIGAAEAMRALQAVAGWR